VDYALVGSALFLLYGHPNLQLNRVAAVVAAWGVLFLLLPGVQKSRLQTIGALHGWIAWLSAAYLLVVNPPENLTLDFESHSPESSALFKFVTGFYFWLSVNSITQRFRTRDHWLTTAHHIAVAYVYGFCLFPEGYLHKYGLLYLVQESSSSLMALRSFAARHGRITVAAVLERGAVVCFVSFRILLGIPVSLIWWINLWHELAGRGTQHPKIAILSGYMVCNVLLNCLNSVWLCNIIKFDGHCIMRMQNSQCSLGCNQADDTSTISCHGETMPSRAKAVQQDKQRAQWCKAFQQVLQQSSTLKFTRPLCERADKLAHELILRYGRQKLEALQLDVVIGGGGWRGQYAGGAVSIFQALEKLQLRVVPRYSGASIGAITAAYFASASGYSDYIASHNAWQALWKPSRCWRGKHVLRAMLDGALPPDAHKLCNGRVFINISVLGFPPSGVLVDKFDEREDLVEALVASASLPGLTGSLGLDKWAGMFAVDGGLTNNVPLFTDGLRDQLVVNLGWLEHAFVDTFTPLGKGHDELLMRGQDDLMRVLDAHLSGGGVSKRCGAVEIVKAGTAQRIDNWGGYLRHRWSTDVRPWMSSFSSYYQDQLETYYEEFA